MAMKTKKFYTTSSCEYCDKLDTDDMVQCDSCDAWFHFECVGVTSDVANRPWICDKCKFALPRNTSLKTQDKENCPPENPQWRNLSIGRSQSSVSSTKSKALALQRLDEERQLISKRDREFLDRKYAILEGSIDELGEHQQVDEALEKVSFERTLNWATEVHHLSDDFENKFTMDNMSISLSKEERNMLGQRFNPQASSSATVQRQKRPLFKIGERQVDPTEVKASKPLQSEVLPREKQIDVKAHQVDNASKPIIRRATIDPVVGTFNSIQPAKLKFDNPFQFRPANSQTLGQPGQNIEKNALSAAFQRNHGVHDVNFGGVKRKPSIGHGFQSQDVPKSSSTFGFQSQNVPKSSTNYGFQFPDVPPKMDFNTFGFSTVQPVQSNQKPLSNPSSNSFTGCNFGQPSANVRNTSSTFGQSYNYALICQSHVDLTPNQITARHTMNRRLPKFFGEPTKWQMFESAFINATISCGLSNAENLSRLMDCLDGKAMEAVKCRLLHPVSVPGVMDTLRLMYGRPELIIHSLLEEIEKTVSPKSDDLGSLIKFAISVQNLCSTIESYKADEHLRNPSLMKALTDKLPSQIQLTWAIYKNNIMGEVNLSTLSNWLYGLATVASDVVTPAEDSSNNKKTRKEADHKNSKPDNYINFQNGSKAESKLKSPEVSSKNPKKCPACNKNFCKVLEYCEKFKKLNRHDRWKLVKSNNMCGCCFGNHRYFNCKQKKSCGVAGCSYFHHVLLHNYTIDDASAKRNSNDDDGQNKTCNSMKENVKISKFPDIFRIVPVNLYFNGKSIRIYVYFDDGSNLTTLEKSVAQKLGLRGSKESLCVKWSFGETQVESDSNRISVQISGVHDGAETFILDDVRTVNVLKLPMQSITKDWLRQYSYFEDVPITPYSNAIPQMIIGLQYSKLMVSLETIEGNWDQPIVCKTRLGWVVQGPNDRKISSHSPTQFSLNMCECQSLDNNLHQLVKGFFSLESFGVKISDRIIESKDMQRARHILESSTIKNGTHYEAALLWKEDGITLPNSFDMAIRRLECVESKMKKNPVLAERICNYFADFLDKGYIRKLSQQEQHQHGPHTWYLPVFPVFHPKKPEKLRLVWDGAAKVKGISLNSQLLAGPDQLIPLPDILRRFREGCIGLSTDIIEMYHRVFVNEEDQDSQRFLWRDGDDNKKPDVFVVKVLPFGLSCSPAIAQFVKNKNAQNFKKEFPVAVEAITKNHYVDDMIERAHDVATAVKLVKDVQFIHQHANFDLRNLLSNNRQVLEAINGSPEFNDKILTDKLDFDVERILGMYWNTKSDTFTYSLQFIKLQNMTEEYCPTKREVLRIVMSVFDPLGFLAHLLIHAKVLLQEIWRNKIGWDDQLPISLTTKWMKWVCHLKQVENLHIPRLYSPRLSPHRPKSIQLHIFVDASIEGYATCAYFRIEDDTGVDSQIKSCSN